MKKILFSLVFATLVLCLTSCVSTSKFNTVVSELKLRVSPPGTIIAFGGEITKIPKGWLLCDGQSLPVKDEPGLFAAIKNNWGGDGIERFSIPDLRGKFLRGADLGTNVDPDATKRVNGANVQGGVGSQQNDAFQGHWHDIDSYTGNSGGGNIWSWAQPGRYDAKLAFYGHSYETATRTISDNVNGQPSISSETRPKNVYVNYIIKL